MTGHAARQSHPVLRLVQRTTTRRAALTAALIAGALAAGASATGCARPNVVTADDRPRLADGARFLDSLRAAPLVSPAGAVALGYAERVRLGVGAPFRLVEQATLDTRLPAPMRARVAWALLEQVRRGDAFVIDSTALGDGPDVPPTVLVDGGWHRAFIDSLVAAAPSPRTGEETVRLAYTLARAEWLVTPGTAAAAIDATALARDRRLARSDVDRLLAAHTTADDSTRLLVARSWRRIYAFQSESPLLEDGMQADHARAVADAERALVVMREAALAAGARPASTTRDTLPAEHQPSQTESGVSWLSSPVAARLAQDPTVRTGFPSAPIVVTLGAFRHESSAEAVGTTSRNDPALGQSVVARRLIARSRTDEALAAEWTLARAIPPTDGPERRRIARLVLGSAVAVRSMAQSPPAQIPTGQPELYDAIAALKWRDGIRAVSLDPALPSTWSAPAARQVSDAIADLNAVFPSMSIDGLALRLGESPRHDLALALHDPARRTVYLPPLTGAGTIAHELAHDLDWQTARRQLSIRGTYATDRSARSRTGDSLLVDAVRAMAGAQATQSPSGALGAPIPGGSESEAERPAELFARGVDFFVAATMARDGRSNGALSAVQDVALSGYAGVRSPEPGDGTAEALVDVLDAMTPVPAASRQWYLARFGREGTRDPVHVAADVLRATPSWSNERALRLAGVPAGLSASASIGWSVVRSTGSGEPCGDAVGGAPAPWQPRLLWLTADARARGLLRARALRAASSDGAWWGWSAARYSADLGASNSPNRR